MTADIIIIPASSINGQLQRAAGWIATFSITNTVNYSSDKKWIQFNRTWIYNYELITYFPFAHLCNHCLTFFCFTVVFSFCFHCI